MSKYYSCRTGAIDPDKRWNPLYEVPIKEKKNIYIIHQETKNIGPVGKIKKNDILFLLNGIEFAAYGRVIEEVQECSLYDIDNEKYSKEKGKNLYCVKVRRWIFTGLKYPNYGIEQYTVNNNILDSVKEIKKDYALKIIDKLI